MKMLKFFFILIAVFILVIAVMNESISSYIEQKYHIAYYPQNVVLKEANTLKIKLDQIRAILSNEPLNFDENKSELDANETSLQAELNESQSEEMVDKENAELADTNATLPNLDENVSFIDITKLEIKDKEEFLLIGDSLMQGVAPFLSRDLKDLNIKATDLSKQNTGLSYKSYFDWANATKSAFAKNKNIKYLVVLLGANDPWDIKKGGVYRRFNTDDWLEIYTERVDEIIKIAKRNKAKVFWYEIPPVKKDDFNKKVQVLNQIYASEMLKNKEIFINTKLYFSVNDEFSSYIKDENNKSIKMRTDDGVHFTPAGGKEMAKLLLAHIKTKENNEN